MPAQIVDGKLIAEEIISNVKKAISDFIVSLKLSR